MGIKELEDGMQELVTIFKEAEESKKVKKYKLPFGKKVGKGQKKNNYVTVIIINENGTLDFKKYPIQDQTITHDLIPRLAAAGYVMYYKKNPMMILPNWSVKPISPLDNYTDSLEEGSNTTGYKILMAKMEQGVIGTKKKLGGIVKWIAGLGFVLIVGYAILTGGG